MDFDLQARSVAGLQMAQAHGGELAVHRLDRQAEGAQATPLGKRVGHHVVSVERDEAAAAARADDRLIRGAVVAFITIDPRAVRHLPVGWSVAHRYRRPGRYRIVVAAYYPTWHAYVAFDTVRIVMTR